VFSTVSGHAEQAGGSGLFNWIFLDPSRRCPGPPTREAIKTGLNVLSRVLVAVPVLAVTPKTLVALVALLVVSSGWKRPRYTIHLSKVTHPDEPGSLLAHGTLLGRDRRN
jgi:hypothetical protein